MQTSRHLSGVNCCSRALGLSARNTTRGPATGCIGSARRGGQAAWASSVSACPTGTNSSCATAATATPTPHNFHMGRSVARPRPHRKVRAFARGGGYSFSSSSGADITRPATGRGSGSRDASSGFASSVSCANSSAARGLDERAADLLGHHLVVILLDLHALRRRLQVVLGEIFGEIVADARRTAFGIGHECVAVVAALVETAGRLRWSTCLRSVGVFDAAPSLPRLAVIPSLLPSTRS